MYYFCTPSPQVSPVYHRHRLAPILWEKKKILSLHHCFLGCFGRVFERLNSPPATWLHWGWNSVVLRFSCVVLSIIACTPKRYAWGRLSTGTSLEQQSNTSMNTENHSSDTHLISCAQTLSSLRFSSILPCSRCSCKLWCQGQKEWADSC